MMQVPKPCPKCEQGKLLGPRYNPSSDLLAYRCDVCGYNQETVTKTKTNHKGPTQWLNGKPEKSE